MESKNPLWESCCCELLVVWAAAIPASTTMASHSAARLRRREPGTGDIGITFPPFLRELPIHLVRKLHSGDTGEPAAPSLPGRIHLGLVSTGDRTSRSAEDLPANVFARGRGIHDAFAAVGGRGTDQCLRCVIVRCHGRLLRSLLPGKRCPGPSTASTVTSPGNAAHQLFLDVFGPLHITFETPALTEPKALSRGISDIDNMS